MTNLYLNQILAEIKQMNKEVIIDIVDNVVTVTNGNNNIINYLLLIFGKVKVTNNK